MAEDQTDQKPQTTKSEIFSPAGGLTAVQDEHGNVTLVKGGDVAGAQEKAKATEGGTSWQSKDDK